MGLASINIAFKVDMKQFSTEMQSALRDIKKVGEQFQKVGGVSSIGLTAPIVAYGVASVAAFDESAKAVAQVEAGLKSTGGAVGLSSEQLQKMAADLQKVTTFDDDKILKEATANLLTFDKIRGETFGAAQQAALDLSTRLDGDLQSAAIQVGKALQDPIKGIKALSKVGVSFSDGQKATIKSMVETNNLAGAQSIILKELQKEFGGSAEAAAKAGLGPFQVLKNQIQDLSEEFGKIILDALAPFAEKLKGLVGYLQNLSPEAKKTIAVIAGITAVIGPMLLGFGTVLTLIPLMVSGFTTVSTALGTFTAFIAANPIGAIAVAIGLVVGAIALFQQKQTSLNDVIATGNKNAADEIGILDKLYASATNVKSSTEERESAVNKLQELYPAYLKNIDDEAIKSGKAAGIIDQLRDAIFNKSRAIAVDNELQKRANERIGDELELRKNISDTEKEISRLRKLSSDILIKGNAQDKSLDVTLKKSDLIAAQTKLLKIQKDELVKFNNDAKASDQELLNAKEEFSSKTGKLAENEIEKNKAIQASNEDLTASLKKAGTVDFYNGQIDGLKKLQAAIPTTNAAWQTYEDKILDIQKKLDALQGKGPIKLPMPELPTLAPNEQPFTPSFSLQDLKGQKAYYEGLREQFSATSEQYAVLTENINSTQIKIKAIEGVEDFKTTLEDVKSSTIDFGAKIKEAFDSFATSAITSFAQTIGGLFAGANSLGSFFNGMIGLIGKFLSQLGESLIAVGVASTAFKASFSNPYVAIAAGIALTALSQVFSSIASQGIKGYATGGIIGGSSFYGDKILARVNSGELILNNQQQKSLYGMINPAVTAGDVAIQIIGDLKLRGSDILLSLQRTNEINQRTR